MAARPRPEIRADGGFAAAQAQDRRQHAQRRGASQRTAQAQPDSGQACVAVLREDVALAHPSPECAVLVHGVRTEICLVGTVGASSPSTQRRVSLDETYLGSLLGTGDCRDQTRESASDDRDLWLAGAFVAWAHGRCLLEDDRLVRVPFHGRMDRGMGVWLGALHFGAIGLERMSL